MKFFKPALCAAVALACGFGPVLHTASAEEAEVSAEVKELAARYGARSSVLDISLSPSGNKIAYITPGPGHTELLQVVDLTGTAEVKTILSNSDILLDLFWCDWATDTRLICQFVGMSKSGDLLLPYDRMIAVNADGSGTKMMSAAPVRRGMGARQDGGSLVALDVAGEENKILMTQDYIKEITSGTRLASNLEGLGVDLVDINTGRRKSAEKPDPRAVFYVADENGETRMKARVDYDSSGALKSGTEYFYRMSGERGWSEFSGVQIDGVERNDFYPVAVSEKRNAAFGYFGKDGFTALAEVPLSDVSAGKTVFSRSDVDVGSLIRIGRKRRVVGVSYATEKRFVEYFDAELASLAKALNNALPNKPLINFVDASADESKLLIIASSDTNPGTVYLFDKPAQNLEELLPMRQLLVDRPMGKMSPIVFKAKDGTDIPGYLTLPPGAERKGLPAIVLPHGGPSARDEWGFDWIVQFFVARGYAVLQPNYRGSSGYGEDWYGRNGFQSWDIAIGDVNDAGRWLISEGIADPDKLVIAGWSYGGYAALQSQVVEPNLYKAVVAVAPVSDLQFLVQDFRLYTNSAAVKRQVGTGDHVAAGSPRRHASNFKAPVVLFHGTRDLNVDVRHSREMEDALKDASKPVIYKEYEDLQHDLGDSKVRAEMLAEIDAFLSKALD